MAISYVGAGAFGSGTTSATAAWPAGSVNDAVVLLVGNKPWDSVPTNATFGTLLATDHNGGDTPTAAGNGTGSVRSSAWALPIQATAAGTTVVSVTGGTPTMVQGLRFGRSAGVGWITSAVNANDWDEFDTTVEAMAPYNVRGTGQLSAGQFQAGDWIVVGAVLKDDVPTHTGQSVTISGCTVGTITWLTKLSTTSGNDGAMYVGYGQITAGSSPAGGHATYSATASTTVGSSTSVVFVSLRESVPPQAPTNLTATADADSVLIDWDAPSTGTAPDSYQVFRTDPVSIIRGPESTFEAGLQGWAAAAGTTTATGGRMVMTSPSTAGYGARSRTFTFSSAIEGVVLNMWVRTESGTPPTTLLGVDFYTSGGGLVYSTETNFTPTVTDTLYTHTVTQTECAEALAAGAATMQFVVRNSVSVPAGGATISADNVTASLTSRIATVSAPTTSFDDVTAPAKSALGYYVRSYLGSEVGGTTSTIPLTLGDYSLVATGAPASITLSWARPAGTSASGYRLYRDNVAVVAQRVGLSNDFTSNTAGWTTVSGSGNITHNAASGRLVATTTSTGGMNVGATSTYSTGVSVVPGELVTFTGQLRVSAGTRTWTPRISFYTSTGTYVPPDGLTTAISSSSMTAFTVKTVAPPNTVYAWAWIAAAATGATGDAIELDDALVVVDKLSTVEAPTLTYTDTAATGTHSYRVAGTLNGLEWPLSDPTTGSFGSSMIEYVGIPL